MPDHSATAPRQGADSASQGILPRIVRKEYATAPYFGREYRRTGRFRGFWKHLPHSARCPKRSIFPDFLGQVMPLCFFLTPVGHNGRSPGGTQPDLQCARDSANTTASEIVRKPLDARVAYGHQLCGCGLRSAMSSQDTPSEQPGSRPPA